MLRPRSSRCSTSARARRRSQESRRRWSRRDRRRGRTGQTMRRGPSTGLLFALLALLVLAALIVFPLGYTVVLSFLDDSGQYVGWRNFDRIATVSVTRVAF